MRKQVKVSSWRLNFVDLAHPEGMYQSSTRNKASVCGCHRAGEKIKFRTSENSYLQEILSRSCLVSSGSSIFAFPMRSGSVLENANQTPALLAFDWEATITASASASLPSHARLRTCATAQLSARSGQPTDSAHGPDAEPPPPAPGPAPAGAGRRAGLRHGSDGGDCWEGQGAAGRWGCCCFCGAASLPAQLLAGRCCCRQRPTEPLPCTTPSSTCRSWRSCRCRSTAWQPGVSRRGCGRASPALLGSPPSSFVLVGSPRGRWLRAARLGSACGAGLERGRFSAESSSLSAGWFLSLMPAGPSSLNVSACLLVLVLYKCIGGTLGCARWGGCGAWSGALGRLLWLLGLFCAVLLWDKAAIKTPSDAVEVRVFKSVYHNLSNSTVVGQWHVCGRII